MGSTIFFCCLFVKKYLQLSSAGSVFRFPLIKSVAAAPESVLLHRIVLIIYDTSSGLICDGNIFQLNGLFYVNAQYFIVAYAFLSKYFRNTCILYLYSDFVKLQSHI